MVNIKDALYKQCIQFINNRLQTIEHTIASNKNALLSETKSTAGDKHETGRAMLQLEMEKAGQQLESVQLMKETLTKIDSKKTVTVGCLGSIVKTNLATYFISISAGKVVIEEKEYFAISASSPIGNLLLGKKSGDIIQFNGNNITIEQII
ncbi:3-oxoacyl-ACP synthase [Tenacibaculum sp. TC6]|uniref:3-oxoacyl-ACP synthase n=1 Tax=Tenacibaculum sp. TC6 TaxID=3423223 RepID=UPI003D368317